MPWRRIIAVATNTDSYSSRILVPILYSWWLTEHRVLMMMMGHSSSNFKLESSPYIHTKLVARRAGESIKKQTSTWRTGKWCSASLISHWVLGWACSRSCLCQPFAAKPVNAQTANLESKQTCIFYIIWMQHTFSSSSRESFLGL